MRKSKCSGLAGVVAIASAAFGATMANAGGLGAPLGLYGGAFATWQLSDFDLGITPANPSLGLPGPVHTGGLGGGFMVGYDWAPFFDNWTVGVVADASFGDWSQSFGPGYGYTVGVDFLVTMRARVGYWITPDLMPYATAGMVWQGTTFKSPTQVINQTTLATAVNSFTNTTAGWTVGAGLDWAVGHRMTVNMEYLYTDPGTWHFTTTQGTFDVPLVSQQLRVGVKIPLSDPEYVDSIRRR